MILETIKIAIFSLNSNKLRTLLSMLGIIIGVAAVIAVVSIASGTQEQVTARISNLGSNLISISPGVKRGRPGYISSESENVFNLELVKAIVDYCPSVKQIVAKNQSSGLLIEGENNYMTTIIGTGINYQEINKYYPEQGVFFNDYHLKNAVNVIVLGSELLEELFPESNPLGQTIAFNLNDNNYLFEIIGVMQEKDRGITGDLNKQAYIPITTQLKITSSNNISSFIAQASSADEATAAVEQIEYLLNNYLDDDEEFNIVSQDQILETINEVTGSMKLMLSGIAAISLLVGGIGIMNIMLVSVTERTREIGIRKALGAKQRHILGQFLAESLTLSSFGGILGIIIGFLAAFSIARIGGWPFVVSIFTVLLAFVFSLIVGVFFGIYPAVKASRLDPVKALSYE
ncbi:FtsX-like permease family protein [Iocasia frigidifontis]|uniref:FtsX-like permease family protein n=1 Tax=Iocasia fonsfrigidae TaxID=2682810 RepID=A0A8A7KGV7_9FIRM|nr:ABC transporter permease [Iocasia fonsfrigidae]QTL98739.1 FtsX-like permease family protein [Iocasia fonsfrigidae]